MPGKGTELVHAYYEQFLSAPGDLSVADEILTSDVVFDNPISPDGIHGVAAYKEFAERWYTGFPDRLFTVEDTVEEGDKVGAVFTITGTHKGEFMGAAPTGNPITVRGMNIFHLAGGRIRRVTAFFDARQLHGPIGLDG
ncbi:ester cyclase [Streptomyces sp. NPDC006458]|uniref:ester cyclase n=1 Tax=Streptomyces sp. NPDC006458 TaxID=3154302 RepID=UPI0033A19D2C